MLLNGLGFVNCALYLMPLFFKDKPVERLLGEGIEAEHLNEDILGRALDAVYALRLWPGTTLRPTGGTVGQAFGFILRSRSHQQFSL